MHSSPLPLHPPTAFALTRSWTAVSLPSASMACEGPPSSTAPPPTSAPAPSHSHRPPTQRATLPPLTEALAAPLRSTAGPLQSHSVQACRARRAASIPSTASSPHCRTVQLQAGGARGGRQGQQVV